MGLGMMLVMARDGDGAGDVGGCGDGDGDGDGGEDGDDARVCVFTRCRGCGQTVRRLGCKAVPSQRDSHSLDSSEMHGPTNRH